jgi:chromate transporter
MGCSVWSRAVRRIPLTTVLREWGRIGVIGFGGPPAHIALLRELMVERRGWLPARDFEDANAAAQLLPGPASTQMSIYCARRVAGNAGALAGGLAFILPGLVLTIAIAAVALQDDPPEWVQGLGAGAAAAVVAVVAQAGLQLAAASFESRSRAGLARALAYALLGAAATATVGAYVVLVLLACGLAELSLRRSGRAAVHAWPIALPLALTGAAALPALAWTALKVGGLSYGGGFVIVPLMQGDALDHDWLSHAEFANAVAYGQITPGPVTHTIALIGWGAAGLPGALIASAIAFAPSFAFVMLGGDRFEAIRERPGPRAFLDGAGPAAIGAILGAAVLLATALEEWWQAAVLAAAAALLLLGRSPLLVLLTGAAAGVAITTIT